MNKLVFVFQNSKTLQAQKFCGATAPQILASFSHELTHNNRKSHCCDYYLYRASNCPDKIFSSSRAVFLGFYNVSISCHLTVKACQIISDLLAVRLNELETSIIYSS